MDLKTFWDTYGPWGFAFYVVLVQVWPFIRDRYFPARMKERLSDKEFQNKLDERRVLANERMAASTETMQAAITSSNEKMNSLLQLHLEHDRFLKESLMQMAQALPRRQSVRKTSKKTNKAK